MARLQMGTIGHQDQKVNDPRGWRGFGCSGWTRDVAGSNAGAHAAGMFAITEAEAAAIRAAFEQSGELSAVVELRRLFPGVTDNAQAREWPPLAAASAPGSLNASAFAKANSRRSGGKAELLTGRQQPRSGAKKRPPSGGAAKVSLHQMSML